MLLSGCEQKSSHQQRFLQFGTIIDVTLISEVDTAITAFTDIETLLTQRHQQWHGWENGTLKQFNDALSSNPSQGISIPPILDQLLADSKYYFSQTEGLFNPAMGKLVAAWGFHDHSEPDNEEVQRIKKNIPGMDDLTIKDQLVYSNNSDVQLDFGAIAKGLAVKQIAQLLDLLEIESYIINAGGDIFSQGEKLHNQPWRIAIEDPFKPGIITFLETAEATSVFTSGNYQRYFRNKDGSIRHHIINPRTGNPSINISSATVIHADPVIADIAATTLMLTDISSAKNMAKKLKVENYLIINQHKELFVSPKMLSKLDHQLIKQFTLHTL